MSLYNDIVLEHYQHPRNVGVLEGANAVGRSENAACGDEMQLYLEIEGTQVRRASFRTFGCAASIAAGSLLTELVMGSCLGELRQLGSQQLDAALGGLPTLKVHGSVLAADALRAALDDYQHREKTRNLDPLTQTSS
ncbi:MAG: iron-sulfur cluster assembly scaffold protein [Candidatus Latescibacteria bacterium]|nr:iron-sulfur cluster assembly scaffold protein [Candidatus Latescibacterota bacterium]